MFNDKVVNNMRIRRAADSGGSVHARSASIDSGIM